MTSDSTVTIVVGIVITVLAAGTGVSAWVKLHRDRSPRVAGRLWLAETPYYRLKRHRRREYVLEPTEALEAYPAGALPGASTQPSLRIDVTNTLDRSISINEVEWVFGALEEGTNAGTRSGAPPRAQPSPRIAVSFREGAGDEAHRTVAADFELIIERVHDRTVYYRLRQPVPPASVEALVRQIAREEVVADAIPAVEGEPHSPWVTLELVQLRFDQAKSRYQYFVGHTLAARESLTIPITIGSETPLAGTAVVRLLLDGRQTRDIAQLRLRLAPPAQIGVLQEGNDDQSHRSGQ
ncbi:hypothetical protein [Streptomyces sp. NPDC001530]|uniref:hypothetical protein n=1 Tax=Streptomyces sp. NPDC001530 TaxID=3364582 RepID=UPI0036CB0C0E